MPQGSLPSLRSLSCGNAEREHPIPVICLGQAPYRLSAGWMPWTAGMATNYFPQNANGPKAQLVRREQPNRVSSLFSNPSLGAGPFPVSAFMANFRVADNSLGRPLGLPCRSSVGCLDCVVVHLLLMHGCGRSVGPICNHDQEHKNRRQPLHLGLSSFPMAALIAMSPFAAAAARSPL